MEGKVHYCRWERQENGYFVALVCGHRNWRAMGTTFQDAVEALQDMVGAERGDGEVQLDFIHGTPKAVGGRLEFVSVYGAGDCDGPPQQPSLYEGGYRSSCGNPIRPRTRARLKLTLLPKRDGALHMHWNPMD